MVIFLYGSDGYRLKKNVDTIVGAHQKKHKNGMSYYRFDLSDDNNFDDLENAVKSVSFFDEAKLIIVKNAFSGRYGDQLISLVGDFKIADDKRTVMVFIENRQEKELQKTGKELFKFLSSDNNLVKNIEHLNGAKLADWVRREFKLNGYDISSKTAGLLVSLVGNDSWALANEINKLSNYKKGGTVIEEDIELLISRKEDGKIFDLVDAVGNQNRAKAFEMMYRLINSGSDPHYLLSMLVYHLENLLSVSDEMERGASPSYQSIAKKCGLHPFVAKKSINQAQKFSKDDLKARFSYLAGLDIASKNGLVNLEDALYNLVLS